MAWRGAYPLEADISTFDIHIISIHLLNNDNGVSVIAYRHHRQNKACALFKSVKIIIINLIIVNNQ